MNYLAHSHLAARLASERGEEGDGLLIGALLGDHVKGPLRGEYPDDVEEGIRLPLTPLSEGAQRQVREALEHAGLL